MGLDDRQAQVPGGNRLEPYLRVKDVHRPSGKGGLLAALEAPIRDIGDTSPRLADLGPYIHPKAVDVCQLTFVLPLPQDRPGDTPLAPWSSFQPRLRNVSARAVVGLPIGLAVPIGRQSVSRMVGVGGIHRHTAIYRPLI